jgi:selenocysteine lyase/cysteine desulfurase
MAPVTDAPLDVFSADFGPFGAEIWLNAAHQGPLPRVAADAASAAIAARVLPSRIADADFADVPARLRAAIGRLVGANAEDVILGNSASYGLSLLAQSLPFGEGDDVLLVEGDFPASVFPWRVLERRGTVLRFLRAAEGSTPTPDEVARHLGPRTRAFCASWVNSFTGHTLDVPAVGRLCRAAGVPFVLNASQALGARTLDVSSAPIDALVCCGYKWLLGPYGTGLAWFHPELRERMTSPHAYWLPNVWGRGVPLASYELAAGLGARAWDVFGTANFFNFVPWTASIEYLLARGPEATSDHDEALVALLVGGLESDLYDIVSPLQGERRSNLIVVKPRDRDAKTVCERLRAEGIHVALRDGALRLSPHLYNTRADIMRTLEALVRCGQ